jgi:nickel transport system substrate-binding protein
MTLTQPYYGALNDLTMANPMAIVNPAAFNGDPYEICAAQTMGSGPYMYAGDFDGTTYTFVRNPNYWGEAPEVDGFKIKVITDNDAKVLALRSGEIDAIIGSSRLSYDACSELNLDDAYGTCIHEKGTLTRYVGFNLSAAPFNDIRVRQAVAYALDRETLCASVFQGIEKPAETLFEAARPYCDVALTTYRFNLDNANALMADAGWIDSDGDGVREKDGRTLELTMSYMLGMATLDDAVLAIASQLAEIGFKITPSGTETMPGLACSWPGL